MIGIDAVGNWMRLCIPHRRHQFFVGAEPVIRGAGVRHRQDT